jgi:hypothetical protein
MTSSRCALVGVCLATSFVAAGTGERVASPPEACCKPVSLRLERKTVAQALAELSRQSRISVEDRLGGSGAEVSLDLPRTTFWPALDALARAAGARVELYSRDGRLALVRRPSGWREPPLSYSGPFRTALKRVATSLDLETGVSACTATLEVAWEPTLEPLYLQTGPRGLTVRDDRGRSLPAPREGGETPPVDGRLALTFEVPLPAAPRGAARLALLEGKLSAVAPSKSLTFDFGPLDRLAGAPDSSSARRQSAHGVSCRLSQVRLEDDQWTVQVAIDYPPGGVELESYQSRVVNNELILAPKDGKKRPPAGGYVVHSAGPRKAEISYNFWDADGVVRGRPGDWKLLYRTPASLVEVPLTFSFKDVPLP